MSAKGTEKTFELLHPITGEGIAMLKNEQPRQAALKAVGKLVKAKIPLDSIILRECGSAHNGSCATLHRFAGSAKPEKFGLPLQSYQVKKIERAAGKAIPQGMNAKGKEADFEKAGFTIPTFNKPIVRKIAKLKVPNVPGKGMREAVVEFVKGLVSKGASEQGKLAA